MRQPRGQRMALQMIDAVKRRAAGQRQCLAGCQADQHTADQPRSGGGGNGIHLFQFASGLGQRVGNQPVEMVDMRARGQFRHHAAIGRMQLNLAQHHIRQNIAAHTTGLGIVRRQAHNGGSGLVATGLKAQNGNRCCRQLFLLVSSHGATCWSSGITGFIYRRQSVG